MYNVTNEFPQFFRFIAIKIGQKVAESSDVILPRPIMRIAPRKELSNLSKACSQKIIIKDISAKNLDKNVVASSTKNVAVSTEKRCCFDGKKRPSTKSIKSGNKILTKFLRNY